VGHLSYSALAEYERCGYRFYLERLLGVREGAATSPGDEGATAAEAEELTPSPPDELTGAATDAAPAGRDRALAFGNAVHGALEWSARNDWREPEGADPAVAEAVRAWLGSGLRRELDGWRIRPEVPFVVSVGGTVIRGQMDLLAEGPDGEKCVVDFKTDAMGGRSPAELGRRYTAQREVYALAAAADGAPVRTVHLFLEAPDDPVIEEFDAGTLEKAGERLEGLIGRIRGGEFAPTSEPSPTVCFGCPAAARLCPVARWRPPPAPGAEASAASGPGDAETNGARGAEASLTEHVQARLFE
jgi:ATP-dependent helicase/nuclease subunit A